ncbi:sugar phosphate nucleotidyltransferase [Roseburia sp. 1XD42-69]|uniref:sugar phosphate nucleotidyltransferase n=1 Tax=Roseburia sp. 1XD42-69 TaxID=2320088 RepID=UPI000EA2E4EC|nr:sugar phosphate nucleotidyltransferase [Roseburia sp. 1XD42-69]RKJ63766.1 nucleotidyltransferase [Roseburia sp. 1XD42-69]
MEKPVLVVMAAGMGSRYGGLKQMDPMDDYGHVILDFSVYDAMLAGFEKVIFIIKKENESLFKERIGNRMSKKIQVEYVYQELDNLPEGFKVPEGREKPFGTGHAVLSCKDKVHGPFAVINADDFYGRGAFQMIYDYLDSNEEKDMYQFAMVGYLLKNTLTENGHVARGVCQVDDQGFLTDIHERTRIEKHGDSPAYTEDEGKTWEKLPDGTIVSMNLWGFSAGMMGELEKGFPVFLQDNLKKNPLKCEFFLPFAVEELMEEGKAKVKVLKSEDRWYGVTYQEDKGIVMQAISDFKKKGVYPCQLWED